MKPLVAIVGRANVGKSRLFNRIIGRNRAIVHDRPGVTRDRHYAPADWSGHEFIAVDTGGMEIDSNVELEKQVTGQSMIAVEEADVVVALFDGQQTPTVEDEEVVRALRKLGKPIVWVLNKIDSETHESAYAEFTRLGIDAPIMVSAEHGRSIGDMLDAVVGLFPEQKTLEAEERAGLRISIVGRPNVGKSTLINRLAGSDRVVAHDMPGTTRDAIDVEIEFEGKDYIFVDTAGIKKKWRGSERLERFTSMRSLRQIERSHIVCQLIDAEEGLTKQDLALSDFILQEGKGLIFVVNKWDLLNFDWKEYEEAIRSNLGKGSRVPMIGISAKTGYHCLKVFEKINHINRFLNRHLSTSQVNRIMERALAEHHLPVYRGKEVKIYYATQTGVYPPTFTLFANFPSAVPYTYRRYLMHRFQEALGSDEVPVKIVCRRKT